MKIVFDGLIYSLQNQGGISRYFDELINSLAERSDCEVTVLLRKNTSNKVFNNRVRVEIINSTIYTNNKFLKYLSVFIDGIKTEKFLQKRKDLQDSILHHTYYRHFDGLKIKQIITVYDLVHEVFPRFFTDFLDKIYVYNKKRAILKADSIITISENTKTDLIKLYNIDSLKINTTYLGVSDIFKNIKRDKPARPFFLFVGNRDKYKNFPFLLKTYGSWSKKNTYDLICFGGGEFNKEEARLINDLNLSSVVKQISNIADADLVSYYNNATALIYPSLHEGFGLPILEALACGTHVICSDIPVFHEVGGKFPLFFTNSHTDLIRCLGEVTNNIYTVPANPTEWIKQFSWKKAVTETIEVYSKISGIHLLFF
jgi:glycosyltransferase involved in cell wall biosynthesis